jgi:hypothetical protein
MLTFSMVGDNEGIVISSCAGSVRRDEILNQQTFCIGCCAARSNIENAMASGDSANE